MDYCAYNFTQEDNFSQVNIDRHNHKIVVQVKDKDRDLIARERDTPPLESTLELADS